MLVIALAISLLASCNFGGGGQEGPEKPGNGPVENLIYDTTSTLNVIVAADADTELCNEVYMAIANETGNTPGWRDTSAEEIEHEIVIGNNTGREVTDKADRLLKRAIDEKNSEDDLCYVIYSDGSSVAIVFEHDYDGVAQKLAIEKFINDFVDETLVKAPGAMANVTFNVIDDYYAILDQEHRAEILAAAEERVGAATVAALQSTMALYDDRLVEWFASLYDPCICVCVGLGEEECKNTKYCKVQGGGFYFSNSARDNVGYLPDLESTRQALDLLNMSGMTWAYGGNYYSGALPQEMLQAIGRYTQILQSASDGYFRHPQWADIADFDMRLNRDLSWAMTLLNAAKMSPFYTTPTGVPGIGAPAESSHELTTNIHKSSAAAVSKVIATATYPDVLTSEETWGAFLESLSGSIRNSSYGTGSRLSTYNAQIQARDRDLGTEDNPRPLMTMTINWLNSHMNPERGTWVWNEANGGLSSQMNSYAETNGVMKICGLYSSAKAAWPNGITAIQTCIGILTTDEKAGAGVDVYNAWIALNGVYSNVTKYNSEPEQEEAKRIMTEFRLNATDAVLASRDKLATFKRADGSFSYSPTGGSGISMGMPTQVKGTSEGDVNGALIASVDSWGHICSGLGITKIPIFGMAQMYKFRKIVTESNPVIKQGSSFDYTVADFEADEEGEESGENIKMGKISDKASFIVKHDDEKDNNYLEFITGSGKGDTLTIPCVSKAASATAYIFEGDFCVEAIDYEWAYQIHVGSTGYLIIIKKNGTKLQLLESSSDDSAHALYMDLGVNPMIGDWFRLKVVYYPGDHDTVRIKVYYDNLEDGEDELQLIAVSDNYYNKGGEKFSGKGGTPSTSYAQTHIYTYASLNGTLLLDNLAAYRSQDTYKPETDPNNQPIYNVDPPDSPLKTYDFEDGSISEDIAVNGTVTVNDAAGGKTLYIGGGSEISIPINIRTQGTKCASLSFDLDCSSLAVGDLFTVTESEPTGSVFSLVFTVKEDGSGRYVTCVEKNEAIGAVIGTVRIPLGKTVNVKIDYHHDEDSALIYVDGEFVGASGTIYKGAEKRTIRTASIITTTKGEISIDNIVFERNTNSYEEATKPTKNPVIYDFENGNGDAILSGSAKTNSYTSKSGSGIGVELPISATAGAVSVPVNVRAAIVNSVYVEAEFTYYTAVTNGVAHTVILKDSEGDAIFGLALKINGRSLEIYEMGPNGANSTRLFGIEKTDSLKLSVRLFNEVNEAHVYIAGVCIARTGVYMNLDKKSASIATVEISSADVRSDVFVDNIRAESLYEIYTDVKVSGEKNVDSSNPLTFEASNSSSLPAGLIKPSTGVTVQNDYNDVKGEYSNVAVLSTPRGRNDSFGVTMDAVNTGSCVVFETDFKFENPEYDYIAQLFFTNAKNSPSSGSAYGLVFQKTGDSFKIMEYTSKGTITSSVIASDLEIGKWHNLKIEYYLVGENDARIKLYVNGELKKVSSNHYNVGAAVMKDVKSVMFYTFLDSKCKVLIDNMSLVSTDAIFTE